MALFLYLPAPVSSVSLLDDPQPVATAHESAPRPDPMQGVRGTSDHIEPSQSPSSAPAPAAPVIAQVPSSWHTSVEATTTPVVPKTLSPTDPDARNKLVLDIQQQLKRVGCYRGRIDGSWGIATKNALREFTNRVNATLPLDAPDYVQLALIQSHGEKTCGACPAGQSLSASGRCVGAPITAQAKQPNPPQLASEQKEVLPWKATSAPDGEGGQPLFRPAPTTGAPTEPLRERMAIGGPNPSSIDVQQIAPGGTATVTVGPNAPAVEPPATAAPDGERRSSRSYHRRRYAGDGTPHRGYGSGLSLPRRNLLMSLGGLY